MTGAAPLTNPKRLHLGLRSTRVVKNHGKYVECVTDAAQAFWQAKLVTRAQKQAVMTAAAQSACGKRR
ncbi:MAG TPA: hypothetical protein VGK73_06335 [Polyangiaceae bacterium]